MNTFFQVLATHYNLVKKNQKFKFSEKVFTVL